MTSMRQSVAAIFLVYDFFVQRRNRELVKDAVRSDKLVTSLFPGEIKDKILAQQDVSEFAGTSGNKKGIRHLVSNITNASGSNNPAFAANNEEGSMRDNSANTSPLAKIYSQTTIFFGDLAGKCCLGTSTSKS